MNKIWILGESGGQYDDYYENPLRAYKTEESAQAALELIRADFVFVQSMARGAPQRPNLHDFTLPNVPGQLGGNNLDKAAFATASEKYSNEAKVFYTKIAEGITTHPNAEHFARLYEYGSVDEPNFYVYDLELAD